MAEEPITPAAPIAASAPAPVSIAALTAEEKAAAAAAASKEAVKLLLDPSGDAVVKIVKAKGSKNVTSGIVHVISTFNNTLVTVTDLKGNVIGWSSAGKMGFKGSRKSTPFAAQRAAEICAERAAKFGVREMEVRVNGPGSGRESAITGLQSSGIVVRSIEDITPLPHNGCRPPKKRRV